MSFFTLPPESRTLVSKLNTKLALIWKEDFGPLGKSPVLVLLSPGKTPLRTTVAKFLDTSVCGGSWCLDPSLSLFLVKFTQIIESILLDNPHKAAVLSVGCASFSSTLFPSTQLSVKMLGYSTLWTASFFGNECLWLTLLVMGVNDCLLDNCQISSLEDLNYFSLCAFNLFNTWVSQFELNYWNKWTFPRHSNLLRCTCKTLLHRMCTEVRIFMRPGCIKSKAYQYTSSFISTKVLPIKCGW